MKKVHSLVLACVGVASIAAFSAANADHRTGSTSVTIGSGYDYFASKRQLQNSAYPFVAVGYDFNPTWSAELFYTHFYTEFNRSTGDTRNVNATLLNVDGVYRFDVNSIFKPFVLAGIGITGLNPNRNAANNEGNANAGVGVELFIHPSIAFRADARDAYTIVGGKNDMSLNIGITALFGGC